MADKNKPGDYFNRPEKLGAWSGFKQFLWNPDTSQFMGRTSGSWGEYNNLSSNFPLLANKIQKIEEEEKFVIRKR